MQRQLFQNEEHAFEQNSNANLNQQNSLYITEIDYTLLTAKQIDPKFGLMQVQVPRRKIVECDQCHSEMQVEEGTVIYNKKWFHDSCWQSITKGATIVQY
jgi:formylmethanofuran dehydrogenase subunit E